MSFPGKRPTRNPQLTGRTGSMLALRAASATLGNADANDNGIPDAVDGADDAGNGMPNYLNRISTRNVLPEDAAVITRYLIESEPGVRMRVGAVAQLLSTTGGARLAGQAAAAPIAVDEVDNVGGYFSYEARELPVVGGTNRSVVPQRAPIPNQPLYRLWDQDTATWKTFVQNATNKLESAPGEPGFCPAADSSAYSAGLTPGYLCVRLTIEDGGVNDLDHQLDGAIMTTGGIGARSVVVVTGTSKGAGGAGAADYWSILVMLLLAGLRFGRRSARLAAVVLLLPVSVNALAADATQWDRPARLDRRCQCHERSRQC